MITLGMGQAGEKAPATPRSSEFQPLERPKGPVVHSAATRAVCVEVRYEHMEGDRFRHTAQFNPLAT
jgi:hypothetical protein